MSDEARGGVWTWWYDWRFLAVLVAIAILICSIATATNYYNIQSLEEHSRPGDYWYNAPDGIYWAYTGNIFVNQTARTAYFTPCPSSSTQLHCGPFGWNVTETYDNPYNNSVKVKLAVIDNTIVTVILY